MYRKLEVMPRSAAALSLSASSQSPTASSASTWLQMSRVLVDPVPASRLEPLLPQSRRLAGPAQHRQHVGEIAVRAFQADAITDLLGELQRRTNLGETLLGAAQVGEVHAEHCERSDLCLARADRAGQRKRLLADRQRLRMAPGHHQDPRERPQRVRPLRRGRLRRHELDRALDCGESGLVAAGLVEVLAELHVQERRTVRVCVADELDRAPAELDALAAPRPFGWPARLPTSRARRGRARRARPRPAQRARARAPARGGREPPQGRRPPPPAAPRRPTRRALPCCDPPPPSAVPAPPALPLRCARARRRCRACNSSRSPGRIVA